MKLFVFGVLIVVLSAISVWGLPGYGGEPKAAHYATKKGTNEDGLFTFYEGTYVVSAEINHNFNTLKDRIRVLEDIEVGDSVIIHEEDIAVPLPVLLIGKINKRLSALETMEEKTHELHKKQFQFDQAIIQRISKVENYGFFNSEQLQKIEEYGKQIEKLQKHKCFSDIVGKVLITVMLVAVGMGVVMASAYNLPGAYRTHKDWQIKHRTAVNELRKIKAERLNEEFKEV